MVPVTKIKSTLHKKPEPGKTYAFSHEMPEIAERTFSFVDKYTLPDSPKTIADFSLWLTGSTFFPTNSLFMFIDTKVVKTQTSKGRQKTIEIEEILVLGQIFHLETQRKAFIKLFSSTTDVCSDKQAMQAACGYFFLIAKEIG